MASDNEASCESDPNFAVICAFMEKFSALCGLACIDFLELQEMLENTQEVSQELIDLHIKLLRKSRKTVSNERWEKAIVKFCHSVCVQDAWEIERFGYKKARLSSKLRVLKELLEMQFDYNAKFKTEVNKMSAEELRSQPLGKDKQGHAYWFQSDNNCQIRVYKEDPDEETWKLVAKDRDGLVSLISELSDGDSKISSESERMNEDDSNSLAEKPIIDTGQIESSSDSNKKLDESEDSDESKKGNPSDFQIDTKKESNISNNDGNDNGINDGIIKTGIKRVRNGDDDNGNDVDVKRTKIDNDNVGETIEEPVMLVTGEGTGSNNECPNPIVGEIIEEAVMYVYGNGSGVDCKTGNDEKSTTSTGQTKVNTTTESVLSDKRTPSECAKNSINDGSDQINTDSIDRSSKGVPASPVKNPYKLGTIIDTKTDNKNFNMIKSPTKKSRWDVGTITSTNESITTTTTTTTTTGHINKWEQLNDDEDDDDDEKPKKSLFFFGPGCLSFKPITNPIAQSATMGFGQKVPINDQEINTKSDLECRLDNVDDNLECVKKLGEIPKSDDNLVQHEIIGSVSNVQNKIEQKPIDVSKNDERKCEVVDVNDDMIDERTKSEEIINKNITSIQIKDIEVSHPVTEKISIVSKEISEALTNLEENNQVEIDVLDKCQNNPVVSDVTLNVIQSTAHITLEKEKDSTSVSTVSPDEDTQKEIKEITVQCVEESQSVAEIPPNIPNNNLQETMTQKEDMETISKVDECFGKHTTQIGELSIIHATNVEEITIIQSTRLEEIPVEESLKVEERSIEQSLNREALTGQSTKLEQISVEHVPKGVEFSSEQSFKVGEISVKMTPKVEQTSSVEKISIERSPKVEFTGEVSPKIKELVIEQSANVENVASEQSSRIEEISVDQSSTIEGKSGQCPRIDEVSIEQCPKVDEVVSERSPRIDDVSFEHFPEIEEVSSEQSPKFEEKSVEQSPNIDEISNEQTPKEMEIPVVQSPQIEGKVELPQNIDETDKSEEDNLKQIESENIKSSSDELTSNNEQFDKLVPVIEEPCVKRIAYTVGDESGDENNSEKLESTECQVISQKSNDSNINESANVSLITNQDTVKGTINENEDVPNLPLTDLDSVVKDEIAQTPMLENEITKDSNVDNIKNVIKNHKSDGTFIGDKILCDGLDNKFTNIENVVNSCQEYVTYKEPIKEDGQSTICKEDSIKLDKSVDNVDEVKMEKSDVLMKPEEDIKDDVDKKIDKLDIEKKSDRKEIEQKQQIEIKTDCKESTPIVVPVVDVNEKSDINIDSDNLKIEKVIESKIENTTNDDLRITPKMVPVKENTIVLRRGRSRGLSTEIEHHSVEKDQEVKPDEQIKENIEEAATNSPQSVESVTFADPIVVDSSNSSSDVLEIADRDPLAVSDDEGGVKDVEAKPTMTLSSFSLDFNESQATPAIAKNLRKRGRDSPPNIANDDDDNDDDAETVGKKAKIRGKRTIDVKLRKSIEEQRQELLSSDDDRGNDDEPPILNEEIIERRSPPKKKAKPSKKDVGEKIAKKQVQKHVVQTSQVDANKPPAPKKNKNTVNKNKRLLQNLGINPDNQQEIDNNTNSIVGVRQSRRIAQIKIKEEAERRKLEEEMVKEVRDNKKKKSKKQEDKDYKVEKRKSNKSEIDDDDTIEAEVPDKKKRKKRKKDRDPRKLFDESNPWKSSSDSSSSNCEEEEEEIYEHSDDEPLQFKSDHEFSPESDLENEGDVQPLKRARTVKKESDIEEEEIDDCPCQKCEKSDHPEWILLCDRCDNGWHCSCLRPPLLVIPEGDWFCPPCQHVNLLQNLQDKLKEYDKKISKKEIEDRRKERLAYVGISLNNVLPAKERDHKKRHHSSKEDGEHGGGDDDDDDDDDEIIDEDKHDKDHEHDSLGEEEEDDDDSGSDESNSESASESDSDEPIYQLRQRRQAHSYRFNDYDELINSAIQDEMEAVKGAGNQGRGKDIATIVNAEKEEEEKMKFDEQEAPLNLTAPEPLPPVVPPSPSKLDKDYRKASESEEEHIQPVKKKLIQRKKHRKLNSLDISSEDDEDSDEDFKGTSSDSEEEFDAEDLESEDSSELDTRRGKRRNYDPIRRSTRARTSRYDADFIDDGETEEEEEPKKKKKKSIWDESESEESDRSWGRRKRKQSKQKKTAATTTTTAQKKRTKKKKKNDDSDVECYKKKKPKIKFNTIEGDEGGGGRRTRGKKINYVDALGSDSDEERVKRAPPKIESEEEYVANEDEELDEDEKISEDESAEERIAKIKAIPPEPAVKNLIRPVEDEGEEEPNPIDVINKNLEEMDENEMEKMMEEEDYANKQLQLVALQLEKEKKRKEREAKRLEIVQQELPAPKKRGRKPKSQLLLSPEENLIVNAENNDELSEPPGVSLPSFDDLNNSSQDDLPKKRRGRGRGKKTLEEAVANLGTVRQDGGHPFLGKGMDTAQETNIEIATPPQPFSQSQPTPSVITRMLQTVSERDDDLPPTSQTISTGMPPVSGPPHHSLSPVPAHHGVPPPGPYLSAALRPQMSSPFRQMPPGMNHYPRNIPPPQSHQIRNPVPQGLPPSHLYHPHRSLDPSPSGGSSINMSGHNSPGRVVSPATSSPGSVVNKNDATPPPPYARPPIGRFPLNPPPMPNAPRHLHMVAPHLQTQRPNMSPYHPNLPPSYHYASFPPPPLGSNEDAMPPTAYQNSPYSEHFEGVNQSENSNSKSFDEESGGEFGGLVSYFSSQREDDLES